MTLSAQQLRLNPQIAAAAVNAAPFKYGEKGAHVALYQQALYNLGHDLPVSMVRAGTPPEFDGIFGDETDEKTREFQTEQMLKDDGIVGEQTVFMVFTRFGLVPLAIPHDRDLLDRAGRIRQSRAAVTAAVSEDFIKDMNFYLGTLKVSSDDYRRMRKHLLTGSITIRVMSKERFLKIKGSIEATYETKNNRIVLREDRNYFTRLGQATCIHELTHAILDDREIPIPFASRDEAIAYLAEAFYLTRRFNMSFKLDRPSVHIPDIYTKAQPLIDAVLANAKQRPDDIRALQLEALRRTKLPPLSKYIYDGI
jgi:hypothetical protein